MWFPSFFAFESVSKPSYFIRLLPEEELVLDKYDGTKDFKKDASFSLGRKPDASKFFFYLIFNTKITYWTKLIGQNLVKQNISDLKIIYSPFVQKENRHTNFGHFQHI